MIVAVWKSLNHKGAEFTLNVPYSLFCWWLIRVVTKRMHKLLWMLRKKQTAVEETKTETFTVLGMDCCPRLL